MLASLLLDSAFLCLDSRVCLPGLFAVDSNSNHLDIQEVNIKSKKRVLEFVLFLFAVRSVDMQTNSQNEFS